MQTIEVLRDGASAQYGSDAIAGVINVRLRNDSDGGDVTVSYGQRDSSYDTPTGPLPAGATWSAPSAIERDVSDGETLTVSAWKGLGFGETGFLTLAGEYKEQDRTERGGYDFRQQYPLVGTAFDPRERLRPLQCLVRRARARPADLVRKCRVRPGNGASLYGWASYQNREALSAGFFRRALDDRNIIEIYPDGFLPIIAPEVDDYSAAGGVTWKLGEWDMDTSLVYGRNEMDFTIENTLNRSLGTASGTKFDAGGFAYDQLVFNISGVRQVEIGAWPRRSTSRPASKRATKRYEIFAGEPDSYRNGGVLLPNGTPTQSGAQVFPGFRPANEVDEDRTAIGVYVDLEANITDKLLGSAAVRAEDYSDFGETIPASSPRAMTSPSRSHCAARCRTDSARRRCSSSTSPRPRRTSSTACRSTSRPSRSAILSHKHSARSRWMPRNPSTSRSAPCFASRRSASRSTLIASISRTASCCPRTSRRPTCATYLQALGFIGVGGGRFFINGVDTETSGVDMVVNWPWETDTVRDVRFHARRQLHDDGRNEGAADAGTGGVEPAAAAIRSDQRADARGRYAGGENRRDRQLVG